jgi:hypothetical protein
MTISTVSVGIFERFGRGSEIGGAVCAASQKRKNAAPGGQDVSGMAPSFRMTRAQHSRIAVNASSIAALIFKNTCRPW